MMLQNLSKFRGYSLHIAQFTSLLLSQVRLQLVGSLFFVTLAHLKKAFYIFLFFLKNFIYSSSACHLFFLLLGE